MGIWLDDVFTGLAIAFCLVVIVVLARQWLPLVRRWDCAICLLAYGVPAGSLLTSTPVAAASLSVGYVMMTAVRRRWRYLHPPGAALVTLAVLLSTATLVWLPYVALAPETDPVTCVIAMIMAAGFLVASPSLSIAQYLKLEALLRDTWSRPCRAFVEPVHQSGPKVCVHLPCYAEPPDVVIASLDALSQLDYDSFEVIVIDNNTKDPALWRPVEAHCRELGDRFRFFHVDPLEGGKAGALNFALTVTSPDTELIALVDADWQVRADFLARIVGHFIDPQLAAVQAQWDYRGWHDRRFLNRCYWDYREHFSTMYRSMHERGAMFTMGTMCVLRRSAVEEVGGWSTWCLTEDSEIIVRLHAAGYSSTLMLEDLGQGLIPERFTDYAKQRHRWVVGPVQELKRHWRPLLRRSTAFSPAQRLLHLNHGFGQIAGAIGTVLALPVTMLALISQIAQPQVMPVSENTTLALAVGMGSMPLLRLAAARAAAGMTVRQLATGVLASASLHYTCVVAAFTGLFASKPTWWRTNKFATIPPTRLRALRAVRAELAIGLTGTTTVVACLAIDHTGVLLFLEVTVLFWSARFFAAPAAVLLADRELSQGSCQLALNKRK
ncbi:hypothetical protein OV450_7221 [Actinobacteria bacterium OV450]|nr:hypothetical protein OV450_7221 [Actinobacteria bacterium OV450]